MKTRYCLLLAVLGLAGSLLIAGPAAAIKIAIIPSVQDSNHSPDNLYVEGPAMNNVATRLVAKLSARGFETFNSAYNYGSINSACAAARSWGANLSISNHTNACCANDTGWHTSQHGTQTFYLVNWAGYSSPGDIDIANRCQAKMVAKFSAFGVGYNGGTYSSNQGDFVWNAPGDHCLTEALFHDNMADCNVLKSDAGKDAYAQALFEAICDHYGWTYTNAVPELCIEPRGQNAGYYSEDGDANWGNSAGWCNSFDASLTSGGSRYFPANPTSPSGKWVQVRPALRVPGGTYQVDVAHYDNSFISTDIRASIALTNCTAQNGDVQGGSTAAFQYGSGCTWMNLGSIQLSAGQTQPTVKFTYASGNVNDNAHRWNVEGFRFSLVPTASTLTLNASSGGTVGGGGAKTAGDSVTATATPSPGYRLLNWTTGGFNGTVVSTNPSYAFVMPGQNYTLYANFIVDGTALIATSCPAAGGTTTGSGGYNPGQSVTINAIASPGYTFVNWTSGGCGGTPVSSSASYTFAMPSTATTYYANFTANSYPMAATACTGGTATGSGTYTTGQPVTVTATAAQGNCFVGWATDGCSGSNFASRATSYTFNMPPNSYTLSAVFAVQKFRWVEGFESYVADSASVTYASPGSLDSNDPGGPNRLGTNPWWGPSPTNGIVVNNHDGVNPHSGSKLMCSWPGNCLDYTNIAYRLNGGRNVNGNFLVDWWFYDMRGPSNNTTGTGFPYVADSLSLQNYKSISTTSDYGTLPVHFADPGDFNAILSLGCAREVHNGWDYTKYQARVLGASGVPGQYGTRGWINLSKNRAVGWHHCRIQVGLPKATGTNDVGFYIDDMTTPLLTTDSVSAAGYNLIETQEMIAPLDAADKYGYFAFYDDLTVATLPNAPSSASANSTAPDSITWNWIDNSTDEDGFNVSDATGTVKATAAAGASSATETGLAANTQYSRFASAFANLGGTQVNSTTAALPLVYTLAQAPVYGTSGDGAVGCNVGSSGISPYDYCLVFSAVNGFGTGPAKASKYLYVWDTSAAEPTWTGARQWTSGSLSICEGPGVYYMHLRSCNGDNVANPATLTLGPYALYDPMLKISQARSKADGTTVYLMGDKVVTAALPGAFWIEEVDRTSAMKVLYSGTVATGHAVRVVGSLGSVGTQKVMTAISVDDRGMSSYVVRPLTTVMRSLGGGAFDAATPGISDGVGQYNIGMLVRIAGSVTYSNTSNPAAMYFVLDDGSGLTDGSGHAGIKVICGNATPPSSGTARVTGVIDTETVSGKTVPVLIVRDAAEINAP